MARGRARHLSTNGMSVGVDESTGEIVQTMSLASMRASSLQSQSSQKIGDSSDEEDGGARKGVGVGLGKQRLVSRLHVERKLDDEL